MRYQYGEVLKVYKTDEEGAQLLDVQGKLTDRIYYQCEVIRPKGLNSLPKVGDNVLILEFHNSEPMVIGMLEPFDLQLEEGDMMLHSGDIIQISENEKKYQQKTRIKILNEKHEVFIERGDTNIDNDPPIWKPELRIRQTEDMEMILEKGTTDDSDPENPIWKPKIRAKFTVDDEIILEKGEPTNDDLIPDCQAKLTADKNVELHSSLQGNPAFLKLKNDGNIDMTTPVNVTVTAARVDIV